MKSKSIVLWALFGITILVLLMTEINARPGTCTARCPEGWVQTDGSCEGSAGGQCNPSQCTGMISCQYSGSSTITSKVPCRCKGAPGTQMM